MRKGIIYVHGKGGSSLEAAHYQPLFPEYDVVGFDYSSETPWEAMEEFPAFFDDFCRRHDAVSLIANSIGALFSMHALSGRRIERAFFISPIVHMEQLICNMMTWANVTQEDLKAQGVIETSFGEPLSWDYLSWVRAHPLVWNTPTSILYGSRDHLQSIHTMRAFAEKTGAELTVMEGGEHWFHTAEQMQFLDEWIRGRKIAGSK